MIQAVLKRRFYQALLFLRPIIYLLLIGLAILFLVWFFYRLKPLFKFVSVINPAITQINSSRDRVNVLLLGMAGGGHPGADLTDSLMFVSLNLLTGDTVLISLPRDIWVESLKAKLNTAYHFGQLAQPGGGITLAKAAVSEITNQPIHYAAVLDFSGFAQAIDVLGGLEINIPREFTDKEYPIPGKETAEPASARYETIHFIAGHQRLDGATVLKYVRSRHAENEEGTDFARAQRQQLVILAFKNQLLSTKVLLNPAKLSRLKTVVADSVQSDIPVNAYPDFFKLLMRLDRSQIRTGIVDQGSESEEIPPLLYHPPDTLYGQWVLLPVNNNWQTVHQYINDLIFQNQAIVSSKIGRYLAFGV
ncbi:MAG: LCP family protein [Patescibacteria group bacterium]